MQETEIHGSLVPVRRSQAKVLLEASYLWMDMGQFQKAKEVLMGAQALLPKSEIPYIAMGTLEFVQGRHDKALQAYRAAQKLAPHSGLPRAHAGEALLFMGKVPEAIKELQWAIDAEPEGDGAKLARALLDAKEAGVLPPKVATKR
jgi:tetratricopeptide (TPR) repeat protein